MREFENHVEEELDEELEYAEYESAVEKILKDNEAHLSGFGQWLTEKGLVKKTIDKHVTNVEFYINHFLVRDEALSAGEGCTEILDNYLGYHFIKKATWASCAEIKANVASFKKFYTYLLEKCVIDEEAYDEFLAIIKEQMPVWIETMKAFENEEADWYEIGLDLSEEE